MIELELNKKNYKLPTDFSEVMLGEYMKIASLDKDLSDLDKMSNIISILTSIPIEEVKNIKIGHIKVINKNLMFLFQEPINLLVERFEIDGVSYGFNKDLMGISFGEYVDLENYSKDSNKNLDYIMALLYRPMRKIKPVGIKKFIASYIYKKRTEENIENYDINTVKARAELFREKMSVEIMNGSVFFFLILRLIYIENLKQSLTKKEMTLMTISKMKEFGVVFKEPGVG
jgi:hypothetical protein